MVDRALKADNPDMIEEAIDRGWIDKETKTLDGKTLMAMCDEHGYEKVRERLVKLGFTK